jgi:flagella basal body P-ring formation protein FlgA
MTTVRNLFAAALLACAATAADATTLKPAATIDADLVRLGDLFDDAGPLADSVVARAPTPGRRYVLDSEWLSETARAHGLGWRATTRFDRIVVERAGRTIDRGALVDALRDAFRQAGDLRNLAIEFAGRTPELSISPLAPPAIEVQSLSVDQPSGRFSALLVVGGGHPTALRIAVAGRAVGTREVIRHDDVELATLREDALRNDAVMDPARLVGMSARRALRPGETLRDGDVRAPILVARNANVNVVLRSGSMTLSALGRAVEEGARGDTIRVINVQTRRTVEAQVIGPDTVLVLTASLPALVN